MKGELRILYHIHDRYIVHVQYVFCSKFSLPAHCLHPCRSLNYSGSAFSHPSMTLPQKSQHKTVNVAKKDFIFKHFNYRCIHMCII